ncbi:MAG: hypothetical protein AAGF94_13340 [Pseudomonadota bacterium]
MTHPKLRLAAGLTLLTTLIAPLDATARTHCADRDSIVGKLESGYGETRQSIGLGANNSLVEIFASDQTGTWSITVTTPGGQTCLVASGQAFESLSEELVAGDPV